MMQSNGVRKPSYGNLDPPPPLNFGFPAPGGFKLGALDSPTLPSSVYSDSVAIHTPPPDVILEHSKRAVADATTDSARSSGRVRTSKSLDVSDPVHMHLLVETAVGDSLAYDVLSFEELEALKKEKASLVTHMEAVSQKLALESKVRDAAQSLNRLYGKGPGSSGGSPKLHRRSLSRSSNGSSASAQAETKGETELAASAKKCDELSRELWQLERRFREIETTMLKHTAGILQMTHKGPTKRSRSRQSLMNNISQGARPDSPASIFTYENASARSPPRVEDRDNFDERSLYRSPDNLDKLVDALKYGKALTARLDPLSNGDSSEVQNGTLQTMENRLEDLNDRLRQLIIQANPDANREYDPPPKHTADGNAAQRAANIEEKLDYLDQSLRDIEAEQNNMQQKHEDTRHALHALEGRLEGINNQLFHIIGNSRKDGQEEYPPPPPPPEISGQGAQEQIEYMQEILYAIEQAQQSLMRELSQQPKDQPQLPASVIQEELQFQIENYEATLNGLWQIIVSGEEEARQRKAHRRRMLEADPDGISDLEEMSADDEPLSHEFSMPTFTAKVQSLFSRASSLKEKNSILRRQIKQQRELNHKSDAEKEQEFMSLREEISRLREQLHGNSSNSEALAQEEQVRRVAEERIHQLEGKLSEAQEEASTQLAEAEAKMSELNESLQAAHFQRESAEQAVQEKEEQLKKTGEELRELEGQVVRLQTEVTVARAELDGAYGTRAQRAAEVAANPAIKQEMDELGARNIELATEVQRLQEAHAAAAKQANDVSEREKLLRAELRDTIAEFEEITKANVESEKEREGLESVIDNLREKAENLEAQLADEKMRWLGMRNSGVPTGETTSVAVLKTEFKKMMRETRAEGLRVLRAEQEERRRLEQLLRALKKEQLPQKSHLSRSYTAA